MAAVCASQACYFLEKVEEELSVGEVESCD